MAYRFAVIARFALAAIALPGLIAGSTNVVHAFSLSRTPKPLFTAAVEKANPPPGWTEFCGHYVSECEAKPKIERSIPPTIVLTSETWETITAVNEWVNTHIRPMRDMQHRGRINVWAFAE